jgi:hypothetical protein
MSDSPEKHPERQLEFLQALLSASGSIDGDVLEISKDRWAIHGVIPVDGEVLIAEFDTYDEANHVLEQLRRGTGPNSDLLQQRPVTTNRPHVEPGGWGGEGGRNLPV